MGKQSCWLDQAAVAEVLFTDESKFNLSFADGNKQIYRHRGERFAHCCALEHNRWGGGGIMVSAGISADQKQLYMWYAVASML